MSGPKSKPLKHGIEVELCAGMKNNSVVETQSGPMFEKQFIEWISNRSATSKETLIAVGDDACLLAVSDIETVVTTDTLCDQVHFDINQHSLHRIGRKCLAVSVSDVLAMGAQPTQALLTFFFPKSLSLEDAQEIYCGAESLALTHDVQIVGGDTNRYEGPLIVGSTLFGKVSKSRCWRIDGAQIGDSILVTGELGGSIQGKHLDFVPRTDWVQDVSKNFSIHAATDISDSLSLDLDYLLKQSQKGGEIIADRIPVSAAAHRLSKQTSKSPLEHALGDGEDFELLFCVSKETAEAITHTYPNELTEIGYVTDQPGLVLVDGTQRRALKPSGYIH